MASAWASPAYCGNAATNSAYASSIAGSDSWLVNCAPGNSPDAADLTKLCRDVLAVVVVVVVVVVPLLTRTGTQPGMHMNSRSAPFAGGGGGGGGISLSSPAAGFLLLDRYLLMSKSMVASWIGLSWMSSASCNCCCCCHGESDRMAAEWPHATASPSSPAAAAAASWFSSPASFFARLLVVKW
ncbi:Os08g0545101 [Oryza sativa Japonica Group]|uniref:Os08g0545101 protein n=1 Tax=Oryza sativa subsp. japonica TaxID=39947 RepID=C7J686_ORYSJ|nr:Os08g0545101 [Oryza sativa Japonica Group]|eukprot:NP_001175679.1 Os08g0545101 [Oryza sativa Japonica Group]